MQTFGTAQLHGMSSMNCAYFSLIATLPLPGVQTGNAVRAKETWFDAGLAIRWTNSTITRIWPSYRDLCVAANDIEPSYFPTSAINLLKRTLRAIAGPLFAAILFLLAIRLLIHEAQSITWDQFMAGITGVPRVYIAIAAFLISLNYVLYICYDLLALRYLCRSLPLRRVALTSLAGYTLGNSLGTLLAGAPIRFRYYSRFGLTPRQILVLISILGLTFWSGLWFLGGIVLVAIPIPLPPQIDLPFGTRVLGALLLSQFIIYFVVCLVWRKPWPIGKLHLCPPEPGLMLAQTSVAAVDLLISATALHLVLPGNAVVPFTLVLAAYLVGIAISLITQVPGGLGVLELVLLTLLKGTVGESVLASVLIFRFLYYILPLFLGMVLLVAHEIYGGAVQARGARRGS